jgi:hypothetical protein
MQEVHILNPLLIAAALDTVVAPYHDQIYVHEWGAVVYRQDIVEVLGACGDPVTNYGSTMIEAPVIYLYGPEFTGDFTVRSTGRILNTYPEPDESFQVDLTVAGGGSAVLWRNISTACPYLVEEQNWAPASEESIPGFDWAADLWRDVESLIINRDSDAFSDKFLYYEVDFESGSFPLPLPGRSTEGSVQVEPLSGEVLVLFRPDFDWIAMELVDADDLDELGEGVTITDEYTAGDAMEILTQWAGDELKEPELRAMWNTWESYVLYGDWEGTYLVVFPMPAPLVARISELELTSTTGLPVSYHRFFLGFSPWNP